LELQDERALPYLEGGVERELEEEEEIYKPWSLA
jgi:hypothetical protein